MINILDLSFEELSEYLIKNGEKSFRASQIFSELHNGKAVNEISNISKVLKEKLNNDFNCNLIKIEKKFKSSDGTEKMLFSLYDGNIIEGVLMKYKYGNTLCVSTQVGCRMGCSFCASTKGGLIRSLSSGEILGQVLSVNRELGGNIKDRQITNVVLMGSGEPLDNYDNVTKFFRLVCCDKGINIAKRNISISTCGIVPKMIQLADEDYGVTLTISLHNTLNNRREKFMPITKTYGIEQVIGAGKYYFEKTGRRVIIEYSIIKGENDSENDAQRLSNLLKGFPVHVNIIVLNPIKEERFNKTTRADAYAFSELLTKYNVSNSVRRQMGVDIQGACGQLRRSYLGGNKD